MRKSDWRSFGGNFGIVETDQERGPLIDVTVDFSLCPGADVTSEGARDDVGRTFSNYYGSSKNRRLSPRALTEPERAQVLDVLHSPRFCDIAPGEVVATLLDEGTYLTSERTTTTVLRHLRQLPHLGRWAGETVLVPWAPDPPPSSASAN